MTTRRIGYLVTLAEDVREDSDAAIVTALRMVSGVLSVEPIEAGYETHLAAQAATTRAMIAVREAVLKALADLNEGQR